jgi:NADH-quinone oxidoreductase subunit J
MFLILSLLSQAVLYIQLDAVFVGALLIIVYAGAIVTLFLFVIMLLNLRGGEYVDQSTGLKRYLKLLVAAAIGGELIYIVSKTALPALQFDTLVVENFGEVKEVAMILYSKYLYGFEVTSILLLVAIVGALLLAREPEEDEGGESKEKINTVEQS